MAGDVDRAGAVDDHRGDLLGIVAAAEVGGEVQHRIDDQRPPRSRACRCRRRRGRGPIGSGCGTRCATRRRAISAISKVCGLRWTTSPPATAMRRSPAASTRTGMRAVVAHPNPRGIGARRQQEVVFELAVGAVVDEVHAGVDLLVTHTLRSAARPGARRADRRPESSCSPRAAGFPACAAGASSLPASRPARASARPGQPDARPLRPVPAQTPRRARMKTCRPGVGSKCAGTLPKTCLAAEREATNDSQQTSAAAPAATGNKTSS